MIYRENLYGQFPENIPAINTTCRKKREGIIIDDDIDAILSSCFMVDSDYSEFAKVTRISTIHSDMVVIRGKTY